MRVLLTVFSLTLLVNQTQAQLGTTNVSTCFGTTCNHLFFISVFIEQFFIKIHFSLTDNHFNNRFLDDDNEEYKYHSWYTDWDTTEAE